jgi:hypothetical protein
MRTTCLLLGLLGVVAVAAGSPRACARPRVQGGGFSSPLNITNQFFPFEVGAVKVFAGVSDKQKTAVVDIYLPGTRTFVVNGADVDTRILQETEFEGGELLEISRNYFAQADDGTVYYFGEVVDIYEDGVIVSHEGSWLVGGGGGEDPEGSGNASAPAVFMPPDPKLGQQWKPEDIFPIADETATVVGIEERVRVPAGSFVDAIRIRETSPPSFDSPPGYKWYAPGQGVIQAKSKGETLRLLASTF